jgi:hypothetical protein
LEVSVLRSVQVAPHITRGDAQVVPPVHAPLEHVCPAAQRLPQPPQLVASERGSVHEPEHSMRGAVQPGMIAMHVPAVQVPESQRLPQEPQLFASLRVSTQAPEHIMRGAAQVVGWSGVTTGWSSPTGVSSPASVSIGSPPPPPPRAVQASGLASVAVRRRKRMRRDDIDDLRGECAASTRRSRCCVAARH